MAYFVKTEKLGSESRLTKTKPTTIGTRTTRTITPKMAPPVIPLGALPEYSIETSTTPGNDFNDFDSFFASDFA